MSSQKHLGGGYVPQKKCSRGSGEHLASPLQAPPRAFLGKEERRRRPGGL